MNERAGREIEHLIDLMARLLRGGGCLGSLGHGTDCSF